MDVHYEIKIIHKELAMIKEIIKQLQDHMKDAYNRELIGKDY